MAEALVPYRASFDSINRLAAGMVEETQDHPLFSPETACMAGALIAGKIMAGRELTPKEQVEFVTAFGQWATLYFMPVSDGVN